MIWVFASVLSCVLGALIWQHRALSVQEAKVEARLKFIEGQMGATQRAIVKVDGKLNDIARKLGQQAVPLGDIK